MILPALLAMAATSSMRIDGLRCEYRVNPLGIDSARPRLSWILHAPERGALQTAYRIEAASSESRLAANRPDLWDSGKVASDQSSQVGYAGRKLDSRSRVWWRVKVWNEDRAASPWSAAARWEMGLLHPSDWHGQWIGSPVADHRPVYLRTEFSLDRPVRAARYYGTALGLYNLTINGRKVTNSVLRPGWTDYHLRVPYQTYDVGSSVVQGRNAIGIVLADGWYSGYVGFGHRDDHYGDRPMAMGQLMITFQDGTSKIIATDGNWRISHGPVVSADLLMGETYNAQREMKGWDRPGFNAAGWSLPAASPVPIAKRPPGTILAPENGWPSNIRLAAQEWPSVRRVAEIKAKSVVERPSGSYVFDLGQNMVGWARLRLTAVSRAPIRIRYAEMLNPDGTIYTANLRGAKATDLYIPRGTGNETFEPDLTFHGFRYVELTGYPGPPPLSAVTGIVISSIRIAKGNFVCSSSLVNQLQHNIQWGQQGNYLEVPTDCPQRDERLGWMGDAEIFVATGTFNADIAAFMDKWASDIQDAQSAAGG
ncbi:MAG TPA: family 78 glycoside hydrolase catalytic domain, partial [Chthonomonadales bacterium]|nr:family 78 glycoside hydrolase catalytic domain [Chthonomonadales bacterium]